MMLSVKLFILVLILLILTAFNYRPGLVRGVSGAITSLIVVALLGLGSTYLKDKGDLYSISVSILFAFVLLSAWCACKWKLEYSMIFMLALAIVFAISILVWLYFKIGPDALNLLFLYMAAGPVLGALIVFSSYAGYLFRGGKHRSALNLFGANLLFLALLMG